MNQEQSVDRSGKERSTGRKKGIVFFEGNSWYHRTKELMDDLTTKYSKKGGFKTPEEAEKSVLEYEETLPGKTERISSCVFKEQRSYVWRISSVLV